MRPFILLMAMSLASNGLAQDQYDVEFETGLEAVNVRACFDGQPPERLYHSRDASRFVETLRHGQRSLRLARGRNSSRLGGLESGACLQWRVNLNKAASEDDWRLASAVRGDFVSDADLWFFRGGSERDIEVSVTLPEGIQLSAPWEYLGERSGRHHYRPARTPATWNSRIAVGRFKLQHIAVDGTTMRLAVLGRLGGGQVDKLTAWIQQATTSVAGIYGRYPQASPQVIVVPIGPRGEPVPWAHVMRGGGIGAEFFVDETRPLAEFNEDWTACHELSHMLLPFVSSRDRWLPEGLASYYQYVLLSRSGMLTEQQAWQGLYEGFERGRRDTRDQSLASATVQGDWPTMRIYWSGAAMMLLADARLRAESDNEQALDTALAALGECCMDQDRRWRAQELFAQLDRITGTTVFSELYDEHVPSHRFPDLDRLWQSMGIQVHRGRVALTEPAPLASVRKSIMGSHDELVSVAD